MQTPGGVCRQVKGGRFPPGGPSRHGRKWHRAKVEEDKKGKSHREGGGAYKGFSDGHPAGIFVNYHRSSEKEVSRWRAQGEKRTR